MTVTYAPDNPDEPIWMMKEITRAGEVTWWRVRLWTGKILDFNTREQCVKEYWR